jgi:hypothetical protein
MASKQQWPSYPLHKSSGPAIVTLTDCVMKRRKDELLRNFDSRASRVEYACRSATWEARGRRLDLPRRSDLTIAELLVRFRHHAKEDYGKGTKEYDHFEKTSQRLIATYPHKLANEFEPAELIMVRQRLNEHHDWSRGVVNRRVNRIRQIWKRGVQEGIVLPSTRRGRTCSTESAAGSTRGSLLPCARVAPAAR